MTLIRYNLPKITPWVSHNEWMKVYRMIFPESEGERADILNAIRLIKVWKNRGALPIAVESTLAFLEVDIYEKESNLISKHAIASLYAIAIIRFVNGMADRLQKSAHALPVAQLIQKLGIPVYIADIRHMCTHESIPSLSLLKQAAKDSMEWLKEYYWDAQASYENEHKEAIRKLLVSYKLQRKKQMKSQDNNSILYLSQECQLLVKQIVDTCSEDLIDLLVIPQLVSTGFLIPLNSNKHQRLEDEELSENLTNLWSPVLFGAFCKAWPCFLERLFESIIDDIYERQMTQLLETAEYQETTQSSTLAHWAVLILKEICMNLPNDVQLQTILLIVRKPIFLYTEYLASKAFEFTNLISDDTKSLLLNLLRIGNFSNKNLVGYEDAEKIFNEVKAKLQLYPNSRENVAESDGIYIECDREDWSQDIPIGALPSSIAKRYSISGYSSSFVRQGKHVDVLVQETITPELRDKKAIDHK